MRKKGSIGGLYICSIFYKSNALKIKSIPLFLKEEIKNYVVNDHMTVIEDQSGNMINFRKIVSFLFQC